MFWIIKKKKELHCYHIFFQELLEVPSREIYYAQIEVAYNLLAHFLIYFLPNDHHPELLPDPVLLLQIVNIVQLRTIKWGIMGVFQKVSMKVIE